MNKSDITEKMPHSLVSVLKKFEKKSPSSLRGGRYYIAYTSENTWKIAKLSLVARIQRFCAIYLSAAIFSSKAIAPTLPSAVILGFERLEKEQRLKLVDFIESHTTTWEKLDGSDYAESAIIQEMFEEKVVVEREKRKLKREQRRLEQEAKKVEKVKKKHVAPLDSFVRPPALPPLLFPKGPAVVAKAAAPVVASIDEEDGKVVAPLGLVNYMASRCYMDSVLEMFLSQPTMRQKIFDRYAELAKVRSEEENEKKFQVLHALIALIQDKRGRKRGARSLAEGVRQAIFATELHRDFCKRDIYRQQDAGEMMALLMNLLETGVKVEVTCTAAGHVAVQTSRELRPALQLVMSKKDPTLEELIADHFSTEQAETHIKREFAEIGFASFTTHLRLAEAPEILFLHLGRYTTEEKKESGAAVTRKKEDNIVLPSNGIVDLSKYCADAAAAGDGRYEVVSYVVHQGSSVHGGHYISYVKIGDKYFACDDMSDRPSREITKAEFYGNTNCYLVMLKKI